MKHLVTRLHPFIQRLRPSRALISRLVPVVVLLALAWNLDQASALAAAPGSDADLVKTLTAPIIRGAGIFVAVVGLGLIMFFGGQIMVHSISSRAEAVAKIGVSVLVLFVGILVVWRASDMLNFMTDTVTTDTASRSDIKILPGGQ